MTTVNAVNAASTANVSSSNPNAEVFQNSSQSVTANGVATDSTLKRAGGSGSTTAVNGMMGNPRPTLVAQAIVPRQPLTKIVKGWAGKILPVLVPTPTRTGIKAPTNVPNTGGVGRAPTVLAPVVSGKTTSPINTVFSPMTDIVNAPGVPQFNGKASASVFAVVNSALTEAKMSQFALLSPGQQTLARTMLSAAIQGLQSAPGSNNYIAPNEFKTVVDLILTTSGSAKIPNAVAVASTTPTRPQTIPGEMELVPQRPATPVQASPPQTPPQTPPPAPIIATAPQTPPATPQTPAATPQTPATGVTVAITAYPLSAIAPSWWADAIKGADGKADPVMAKNLALLLTDATEFRRQADTINIDRAVDPAKSTLTPRQEWNNWKAA